jgi:hypothetical protein
MLLELSFVAIAARTDCADERLFAGVDADVSHISLSTKEPLVAHLTSKTKTITTENIKNTGVLNKLNL